MHAGDIGFSVIDGVRRFGNEGLIPLGPLRGEPVSRLADVDFLINNGGEAQGREFSMSLAPVKRLT